MATGNTQKGLIILRSLLFQKGSLTITKRGYLHRFYNIIQQNLAMRSLYRCFQDHTSSFVYAQG